MIYCIIVSIYMIYILYTVSNIPLLFWFYTFIILRKYKLVL